MSQKTDTYISRVEIERGLKTAARLVDTYGETYWPVFDRLELELGKRRLRRERLRALLDQEGSE